MRIGLVGCGRIGRRRAEVVRRSGDALTIVADVDHERARAVASEMGTRATAHWEEAVAAEVDAVVVSTTHDGLASVSLAALQAGRHVLVEKPMARTAGEGAVIVEAAAQRGLVLKVGFNHRCHPAMLRAHDLVRAGIVGDPLFARCRYGHGGRPGYEREWRMDARVAGGGELLDQGIHAIDLFRWFLGEFNEVMGLTAAYVWTGSAAPVEDNAFALFRTPRGRVASLHASWTQWKNLFSFEVFGDRGYLIAEGLGGSYGPERLTVGKRRLDGGAPDEEQVAFPETDDSWAEEWRQFTRAIQDGSQPSGSGQDGLQALRLVEAVYESGRNGRVVHL